MDDELIKQKEQELNNKRCIVVLNNNIYKTEFTPYNIIYFYNYYDIYIEEEFNNVDNAYSKSLICFSINTSTKVFKDFKDQIIMQNEEIQKQIYEDVIHRLEIISQEEVSDKYREYLEKHIITKLTETVSKEQIIERETFHINLIQSYIIDLLKVSIRRLYEISKEGITVLSIRFDKLDENYITDNNANIYYHLPNADGKMRPTFEEYFYYLLEKKYKKEGDELSDNEWASNIILSLCKKIYPSLELSIISSDIKSVLPIVKVEIKVNLDNLLI